MVIRRSRLKGFAAMALLLAVAVVACHKEEQAVVGVAQNAVNAEHHAQAAAQAAATERDRQRTALAQIPLPTKSMYVDVREPGAWANPFLSVDAATLNLRITQAPGAMAASSPSPSRPWPIPKTAPWSGATSKPRSSSSTTWESSSKSGPPASRAFDSHAGPSGTNLNAARTPSVTMASYRSSP